MSGGGGGNGGGGWWQWQWRPVTCSRRRSAMSSAWKRFVDSFSARMWSITPTSSPRACFSSIISRSQICCCACNSFCFFASASF